MLDRLSAIEEKYEGLNRLLMSPEVLSTPSQYQKLSKEQAELQPLAEKIREYRKILSDIRDVEDMLRGGDGDLRELAQAELDELKAKLPLVEEELTIMLLPKDPRDERGVILEIRAGTGGEEAALFGASLFRMYAKY
ncbi:MAG TPA: PCRF domain-containing protein, partial [Thermodesulfovibrionales bacterium]|nr:PCRF domain-containing protein [Thermodesulfovibrionales bacterium]